MAPEKCMGHDTLVATPGSATLDLQKDTGMRRWLCGLVLLAALVQPPGAGAQDPSRQTPEELLDAWVELWGSYDLDVVDDLFIRDDRLTYFSSETEGLIQGYDAIIEHHRGFGFTPGGAERDQMIWVDGVEVVQFGSTALIGAIWYFGDLDSPQDAQRGPMSLLAVRDDGGYRIGHMHFATYP